MPVNSTGGGSGPLPPSNVRPTAAPAAPPDAAAPTTVTRIQKQLARQGDEASLADAARSAYVPAGAPVALPPQAVAGEGLQFDRNGRLIADLTEPRPEDHATTVMIGGLAEVVAPGRLQAARQARDEAADEALQLRRRLAPYDASGLVRNGVSGRAGEPPISVSELVASVDRLKAAGKETSVADEQLEFLRKVATIPGVVLGSDGTIGFAADDGGRFAVTGGRQGVEAGYRDGRISVTVNHKGVGEARLTTGPVNMAVVADRQGVRGDAYLERGGVRASVGVDGRGARGGVDVRKGNMVMNAGYSAQTGARGMMQYNWSGKDRETRVAKLKEWEARERAGREAALIELANRQQAWPSPEQLARLEAWVHGQRLEQQKKKG